MSDLAAIGLEQGIHDTYRLWNEGKRDELDRLFRALGPNGFTIEYVGSPAVEGGAAMEAMGSDYGGKCTTEALVMIVNGNVGCASVANQMPTPDGIRDLAQPRDLSHRGWQADHPLLPSHRALSGPRAVTITPAPAVHTRAGSSSRS